MYGMIRLNAPHVGEPTCWSPATVREHKARGEREEFAPRLAHLCPILLPNNGPLGRRHVLHGIAIMCIGVDRQSVSSGAIDAVCPIFG
jgi:hypothetical protein